MNMNAMHYDEHEAGYLRAVGHMDEATSVFFARQLEYIRAQVLDVKKAPLNAFAVFPVLTDIPSGAESATHYIYDSVGTAKIISNYADDLPRVNVAGTKETVTVFDLGDAYGYNDKEIRNAQFANVPLSARKAQMARRAIDVKLNSLAWKGDKEHKITGFLNNPNITEFAVANNAKGTTKVEDMTPDEAIKFINDLIESVEIATNTVEQVNTVLLYPKAYNYLASTPRTDNTDQTILQFLEGVHPEVNRWMKVGELAGAGEDGKDAIVAGFFDDSYIRFEIPERFRQHEVEKRNLEYIIDCTASTVGVTIFIPYAFVKAFC